MPQIETVLCRKTEEEIQEDFFILADHGSEGHGRTVFEFDVFRILTQGHILSFADFSLSPILLSGPEKCVFASEPT